MDLELICWDNLIMHLCNKMTCMSKAGLTASHQGVSLNASFQSVSTTFQSFHYNHLDKCAHYFMCYLNFCLQQQTDNTKVHAPDTHLVTFEPKSSRNSSLRWENATRCSVGRGPSIARPNNFNMACSSTVDFWYSTSTSCRYNLWLDWRRTNRTL